MILNSFYGLTFIFTQKYLINKCIGNYMRNNFCFKLIVFFIISKIFINIFSFLKPKFYQLYLPV